MTDITVQSLPGVRILALDRPKQANALRRDTIRQLILALSEIRDQIPVDQALGGVVLTGDEARFSAGADLAELTGTKSDIGFDDELESLTAAIAGFPLPVIAAIEGPCIGAAVDLAWSCDSVVVSRRARISLPSTRLGILYNPKSLARLHARMGASMLRRLVVLSDELNGTEVAMGHGAVLVEDGEAVSRAVEIIRAASSVSEATASTKALLAELDAGSFDPSNWQELRVVLVQSQQRRQTLQIRRDTLGGSTQV